MKRDALALELRVLNGRHAGACVAARDGLLLGVEDDAEIIITDLDPRASLARLHLLDDGRWLIAPANAEPDADAVAQASDVDVPIQWAGVAVCVSTPHSDWPPAPMPVADEPKPQDEAGEGYSAEPSTSETAVLHEDGADAAATRSLAEAGLEGFEQIKRPMRHAGLSPRTVILLVVVLAALAFWAWDRAGLATQFVAPASTPNADLTSQAQRQVPDLALAIAQVDPALRMELTPRPDGRVQIRGWVESVAQLDRLADVLGARRPAPLMRVLVATDVRTELRAQLAGSYPYLDFVPDGPGNLRVRGIVLTEAGEAEVLSAVRPLLPFGLELKNGLRLAEKLVPEVRATMVGAGFTDARAHWDGNQIVVVLSLPANARGQLENALVALAERFPGLPLNVKPEPLSLAQAAERAKAPFSIRGVVGGPVPYVVLTGGEKLLPGGTHAGWRLQAIEPDVLIFDSPRRLVVTR